MLEISQKTSTIWISSSSLKINTGTTCLRLRFRPVRIKDQSASTDLASCILSLKKKPTDASKKWIILRLTVTPSASAFFKKTLTTKQTSLLAICPKNSLSKPSVITFHNTVKLSRLNLRLFQTASRAAFATFYLKPQKKLISAFKRLIKQTSLERILRLCNTKTKKSASVTSKRWLNQRNSTTYIVKICQKELMTKNWKKCLKNLEK